MEAEHIPGVNYSVAVEAVDPTAAAAAGVEVAVDPMVVLVVAAEWVVGRRIVGVRVGTEGYIGDVVRDCMQLMYGLVEVGVDLRLQMIDKIPGVVVGVVDRRLRGPRCRVVGETCMVVVGLVGWSLGSVV